MIDLKGRTALVTGASSGIGAAIARELAQRGANVVLTARRAERLSALASELSGLGINAEAAPCDLADPAARAALAASHAGADILVNNAGLGVFGMFADAQWQELDSMLNVNIVALTHLTHLFATSMSQRGFGRIMLVASTAAFQPVPLYAGYAATKAYVLSLGEALDVELKPKNVRVTTLCPGVTESEFFGVAGQKKSAFMERSSMTAAAVAKIGVDAMVRNKSSVIAGAANAALAFGTRFAPRSLNAQLGYRFMKG